MYYAHSAPFRENRNPSATTWRTWPSRLPACPAFGAAEEARLAGLLHDLGKYSDRFTLRLEGKVRGLDHWSAGASAAVDRFKLTGAAAGLAVQGHHVGLQSLGSLAGLGNLARFATNLPAGSSLTETDLSVLLSRLEADGVALPAVDRSVFDRGAPRGGGMLDVRMLFSALVDADFLETEAHFARDSQGRKVYRPAGPVLHPVKALAVFDDQLAKVAQESLAASEVNRLRADLLGACREAGAWPKGLFTLSAPTGAGKTLAMLAFALRHAAEHGLRRVVVAVPFLSIIEQTVKVYRGLLAPVFGECYVLEHHSLAGTRGIVAGELDSQSETERTARLLTENWDAPLVVTTSVQLLESLFANRPRACRKLHRLANSVILLDEVQTLPPRLAAPTLATLSHLAGRYGSSIVFATATQPAFEELDSRVRPLAASGWTPKEIVPKDLNLFERARRTRVVWDVDAPRSWDSLAEELAAAGSALCIVNLKKHALALASLLKERGIPGLFHLSTNLCPAHRERILAEVRSRLDDKLDCLLVSTQCVEAGVDVDFPLVLRAFGPLDAIAQAAGRCNRNGNLPELGLVRVFRPENEGYPPGGYEAATGVTDILLKSRGPEGMDLQSPELFDAYYKTLYGLIGIKERDEGKAKDLTKAIQDLDFSATAELYRLIDQDAINVLVPYDPEEFESLRDELRRTGRLTAGWIRQARPHTVNLYRPKDDDPIRGFLEPAAPVKDGKAREEMKAGDWFLLLGEGLYDRGMVGLTGVPENWWIA